MDTTPTPRTDKAVYYMGRKGPDRDGERWCDLALGLLLEAADSVHASLAETDISDSRKGYREGLERRLRSLANVERLAHADENLNHPKKMIDTPSPPAEVTDGMLPARACSAFLLQPAKPTATRYGMRSRGRSFPIHYEGQPAVMMVGGSEWSSKIPRNQAECDQVNAWAEKIISQNARDLAPPP